MKVPTNRMAIWDVSRAHFYAPAQREVYVELTAQHRQLSTTITAHLLCGSDDAVKGSEDAVKDICRLRAPGGQTRRCRRATMKLLATLKLLAQLRFWLSLVGCNYRIQSAHARPAR